MPTSNVRQLTDNGVPVYPITDRSLVIGLQDHAFATYVMAWDGASTPVPANIPAGVVVTYNGTDYTGTLAASASTAQDLYLVASGSQPGEYDRYITTHVSSTYAWNALGSTAIVSPVIADDLVTNDSSKALSAKQGKILGDKTSELEAKVSDLEAEVGDTIPDPDRQDFPAESWTTGKFIYSNTGLEGNVSSDVSDSNEIDVSAAAGKTIHYFRIALTNASGTIGMAFYDSNNAYISGEPGLYGHSSTTMVDGEILVPSNAKYARFSCLTAQKGNFYAYVEIPGFIFLNGIGKQVQDLEEGVGGLSVMKVESTNADFKLTDKDGYAILELDGGNIKTKNFDSNGMPSVESTSIDLNISDGNGKSVLKLKDGGIKTKNFDSEKLPNIEDSLADYEIADADNDVLMRIRRGHIVTANFDSEKAEVNQMAGKKIVWYGTSIPAAGYPEICGEYLNATVHNEAVGGSMCRMGMPYATPDNPLGDMYGIVGLAWTVVGTSLSMKQSEKNDIFLNWTTARRQANLIAQGYTAEQVANVKGWGELLTGNPPADIMSSSYDLYRKMYYGMSYDSSTDIEAGLGYIPGKVEKYLTEDSFPDLWVFDHGHNDDKDNPASEIETIPTPFNDRHYFIGSVNYLINYILQYNPRARFLIIGHYDRDEIGVFHHEEVTDAQIKLAEFWNAPIYKTWEYSFVTRSRVVTTNAYWDENGEWHDSGFDGTNGYTGVHYDGVPENIRQVDGVWVHDMSLLWVHMLDGLHPAQEEYKDFLGHSMAKYISSLIVNF